MKNEAHEAANIRAKSTFSTAGVEGMLFEVAFEEFPDILLDDPPQDLDGRNLLSLMPGNLSTDVDLAPAKPEERHGHII